MTQSHYHLGLPAWAFPGWQGQYFDDRPAVLGSYASVFNTVEGNTTFYRVPDRKSVDSWARALAGSDFRFCFKLPQQITHERHMARGAAGATGVLEEFLSAIEPLGDHVGPLLVQFPASADISRLEHMEPVFDRIAHHHRAVIEVRHPEFFTEPERLEPVLARYGFGRVILDSRPLYQGDTSHPEVQEALHEKPDVPVLPKAYNGVTLIRLILHPDPAGNDYWLNGWAGRVSRMLKQGLSVWMMVHCPNNQHCPPMARDFHERLRSEVAALGLPPIPALPAWPVPQQGSLL